MTVGITELPPEGMQLGGVALAGDAERGTKTTEGLSLLFTTAGITVQGPQPQIERLLVWSGLDSANCSEKVALPDGRNAAVMELTSGGQAIRFLLPLDTVTPGQAAYLDQALPAWLSRYKGGTASATPPPPAPAPSATGANTHEQGASAATAGPVARPPATNGSTRAPAAATPPPPSTTVSPGNAFDAPPPPPAPERQSAPADAPGAPGDAPFVTGALPTTPAPPAPAPPPPPAASGPTPSGPAAPPPPAPAPPPPPAASGPTPSGPAAPPPPPPPPAAASAAAGTAAWTGAPSPATTGSDGPPADVAAGKKSRRRKSKDGPPQSKDGPPQLKDGPPLSASAEASGGVAPAWPLSDAPSAPPVNPVPLTTVTLPPPPAEGPGAPIGPGAVVWQPPIDPTTGEALWDHVPAPSDSPAKRAKGWRRGAEAGAVGAAGATGAVAAATTTGPELAASPAEARPPDTPDGGVAGQATGDKQAPRRNRPLITVLVIVLVVLLGGIAYFAVKRNNNSTTTTATSAVTSPSPSVAAAALAASVNLRIADLPTGWVRAPAIGQVPTSPVAPVPAQARANQALAGCLGVSYQTTAGLFDNATLPGQTGAARSPTFQSGSNPNVLMYSVATVLGSTTQLQNLEVPFTNPNFVTCFGQYQSSLAAAAVPGATASVQSVTLTAPAGVTAYGYLTTLTIPNQAGIVIGEAFLLGGRIETLLEPSTNGPSVPSSDFTPAFDAVTARMAAAVSR